MKRIGLLAILLLWMATIAGCSDADKTQTSVNETGADEPYPVSDTTSTTTELLHMFTDRDLDEDYADEESAYIYLETNTARCTSNAVQIEDGKVTITDEGTYILMGTFNGMVIVNAEKTDKLRLVLEGASIESASSAAIYVLQADKVVVTLSANTTNRLASGDNYVAIDENDIDAAVYSREDLTLNGMGELIISAPAGHGIVSKDDLVIAGGTYIVTAAGHGFSANDSIRVANGEVCINAGKDGLQAENEEATLGYIYIADGTFDITAAGDGISASAFLQIDDGNFAVAAGGGDENALFSGSGFDGWGDDWRTNGGDMDATVSTKGMKASGAVVLNGGVYVLNTADDGLHSNVDLTVNGGSYQITAGDDGMHADNALTIAGGEIVISNSYEGMEGQSIDVNGGTLSIVSSDDGMNAAGGNDQSGFGGRWGGDMFAADSSAWICIAGGAIQINAEGDGIDSNGDLTITGGEVYVAGPSDNGNGALDYAGNGTINGAVLVAVGASGMAQSLSATGSQGIISHTGRDQSGNVWLADGNGNILLEWSCQKNWSSTIISCPGIVQGESYSLTIGAFTETVEASSGSSSDGFGGRHRGGW